MPDNPPPCDCHPARHPSNEAFLAECIRVLFRLVMPGCVLVTVAALTMLAGITELMSAFGWMAILGLHIVCIALCSTAAQRSTDAAPSRPRIPAVADWFARRLIVGAYVTLMIAAAIHAHTVWELPTPLAWAVAAAGGASAPLAVLITAQPRRELRVLTDMYQRSR